MEAVPRLPMIKFEFKTSTDHVSFTTPIKQYIQSFYNEDAESYSEEIYNLEALRRTAVRPTTDIAGLEILKKYYCQLHFLKSRFPMEESQPAAVLFSWKDNYSTISNAVADINFELMCILYNIGAMHTQLGALDSRVNPEGMKMACTHFQCAAWAFQTLKDSYFQMVPFLSSLEVVHFMYNISLAQAQECILEKSMLDNRKPTVIAKIGAQVVDFYRRSLMMLQSAGDDNSFTELVGTKTYKEWIKYLSLKVAYHKCIALLFQGQQAEEQQKMGERVAFYEAACEQLEEARKIASSMKGQQEIAEAIGFTSDVVEGKRKAAKNENEFIYHEEVPSKDILQEIKGASLVKGIPFSVNDVEVSGPDIFARLVPMEAHEASSLYSEKKAQLIRQLGELVETKDQVLAEFMSSLQLEVLTQMRHATGLPQELVDRAAALAAKPTATQELINVMAKLSDSYHEVEAMLNEIQEILKEEEESEKEYQKLMGKRPPSIIFTDLSREAAKYREAHNKANESNQNLHKAMTNHLANLKILSQPLKQLKDQIPSVELPNANVDNNSLNEIENLTSKVEEMRSQRAMLWAQFRDAVHKDDITSIVVTRQPNQTLEQIFQQELQKHQQMAELIEQNSAAQENILKAFVEAYARFSTSRKYLQDTITRRANTVQALMSSYDTYDDLLGKANKGIEFYTKLETNVTKLLQRIKSACKVQQEEREQMLSTSNVSKVQTPTNKPVSSNAPKLKDYLDSRKRALNSNNASANVVQYPSGNYASNMDVTPQTWPPGIRPAPLGSEVNVDPSTCSNAKIDQLRSNQYANTQYIPYQYLNQNNSQYNYQEVKVDQSIIDRMSALSAKMKNDSTANYAVSNNIQYPPQLYNIYSSPGQSNSQQNKDYEKNMTSTTNTYQVISSSLQNDPNLNSNSSSTIVTTTPTQNYPAGYQYSVGYDSNHQQNVPTTNYQQYVPPTNYPVPSFQNTQTTQASSGYVTATSLSSQESSYSSTNIIPKSVEYTPTGYQYPQGYNTGSCPPGVYDYAANYPQYSQASYSNSGGYNTTYTNQSFPQQSDSNHSGSYATSTTDSTSYYALNTQNYAQPEVVAATPALYQQQQNYQSYTTPPSVQQQYIPTHYTAYSTGNIPQTNVVPAAATTITTTKDSYVDLLSGLDFTVNQTPLVPEQNLLKQISSESTNSTQDNTKSNNLQLKAVKKIPATVVSSAKKNDVAFHKKPLDNSEVKKLFTQEIDKFEKFVDALSNKTLSGPTGLEVKWKEIQEKQEADGPKKIISVARCYPLKNRYPDILPYDFSRVELSSTVDDYINASFIKDITPYAPSFIVTQLPLSSTVGDFWTMVYEKQVELICCLQSDNEILDSVYWPKEVGKDLNVSNMLISLQSATVKSNWTERYISINLPEKRESRVLIHLQFTAWPGSLFPTSADPFASYIKETIGLYQQQRSVNHPIVVHCSSGIGRSGLLCLLTVAILDVTYNPTCIPDLAGLTSKLSALRKNILRDREHLKFAYQTLLSYIKSIILQDERKVKLNDVVLIDKSSTDKNLSVTEVTEEKSDPLSNLDPFWASKRQKPN